MFVLTTYSHEFSFSNLCKFILIICYFLKNDKKEIEICALEIDKKLMTEYIKITQAANTELV